MMVTARTLISTSLPPSQSNSDAHTYSKFIAGVGLNAIFQTTVCLPTNRVSNNAPLNINTRVMDYVELTLGWLLRNAKGRDAKSFYTCPAFEKCKEPTIPITSPDCGESGVILSKEYIAEGGKFPILEWSPTPQVASQVKEWLLVSEDPDAPLPTPICHG
jgi:hypothetical protein